MAEGIIIISKIRFLISMNEDNRKHGRRIRGITNCFRERNT